MLNSKYSVNYNMKFRGSIVKQEGHDTYSLETYELNDYNHHYLIIKIWYNLLEKINILF